MTQCEQRGGGGISHITALAWGDYSCGQEGGGVIRYGKANAMWWWGGSHGTTQAWVSEGVAQSGGMGGD